MNCEFYLLKSIIATSYQDYRYKVDEEGNLTFVKELGYAGTDFIETKVFMDRKRLVQMPLLLNFSQVEITEADENQKLIAQTILTRESFLLLHSETKYIALSFQGTTAEALLGIPLCYAGYKCQPHYKKLTLKHDREANQIFFRKTLDGKITLHGPNFYFVANSDLEDRLLFNLYRRGKLESTNWFNKSDCKLDWAKERAELKFYSEDRYTKILEAYENTFDLIRCAPAITPLQLTKRVVYQLYQSGGNTITNYFANTYYENEVLEVIDDTEALRNKFHFNKLKDFTEVNLTGLSYEAVNTLYVINGSSQEWKGNTHKYIENGVEMSGYGVIKIVCENLAGEIISDDNLTGFRLSDGSRASIASDQYLEDGTLRYVYTYDMYRIYIYLNGTRPIYKSRNIYADTFNGNNFSISGSGSGSTYLMDAITEAPYDTPEPASFYLGDFILTRGIWARMLADVDTYTDSAGNTMSLYDLPNDDFATARGNYKKCIGLGELDLWQTSTVISKPTKYGINDYGSYFTSNFLPPQVTTERPMPVARSNWGNTSLWITEGLGYKKIEQAMRKTFTLKDAYSIAAVIKALLAKIDKNIIFEASSEYSSFLYSNSNNYGLPVGYSLFITPKSNVLKGNYDQAARKAEVTFKEIMDMLYNCFRCYWFIDDSGRFRIEHVSYFDNQSPQIDLTRKQDKYNKKETLLAQSEVSFDKNDLPARYEFNWMDDSTDLFGNFSLDINSQYVQKDKHEEITVSNFSTDVDMMMLLPEKFSEDGFVLLIAKSDTGEVPIVSQYNFKDEEFRYAYDAEVQNFYASWLYLIKFYLDDMPAKNISYSSLSEGSLIVRNIKRSMTHEITCPEGFTLNPSFPVKTSFGVGTVENIDINIDTEQASLILSYVPI